MSQMSFEVCNIVQVIWRLYLQPRHFVYILLTYITQYLYVFGTIFVFSKYLDTNNYIWQQKLNL